MRIFISIFILFFASFCSNKFQVELPNGFIWQGDTIGSSHLSCIIDNEKNMKISNIMDIFVFNEYVYGCLDPQIDKQNKFFILDTRSKDITFFQNAKTYSMYLKSKELPDGFLKNAINILEVRKGQKSIYWKLNQ